jgi:hypothetical protein
MDSGTIAIIGIIVACVVTLLILLVCLIVWCMTKIHDDTNIRKRVLAAEQYGGMAQEVKQVVVPEPVMVPAPMPMTRVIEEIVPPAPPPMALPPPPRPEPQPQVVVHEVVHRYEPEPQQIVLPPPQPAYQQRIVRRSSWSAPMQPADDEWVMVKKKKKTRRYQDDSDSDDDDVCRHGRQVSSCGIYGGVCAPCAPCVPRCVNSLDLAVPMRPMGAPLGTAALMVGARPMMTSGVNGVTTIAATPVVPLMAAGGSSFQTSYVPVNATHM